MSIPTPVDDLDIVKNITGKPPAVAAPLLVMTEENVVGVPATIAAGAVITLAEMLGVVGGNGLPTNSKLPPHEPYDLVITSFLADPTYEDWPGFILIVTSPPIEL